MISSSPNQTISFAKKFAAQLKPGTVLGLVGELGAGKTQFTKGLAQGFGITKNITSPTFVLLKQYSLKQGSFIHIDCYRLSHPEELLDVGFNELVNDSNNIVVIEWADKIKSIMPKKTKWIKFKTGKGENQRIINF